MPAFQFEDFNSSSKSTPKPSTPVAEASQPIEGLEEVKLAAFESGYKAGWDDAAKATEEDQAKAKADLAHNLEELSFTFVEARQHVLQSIEPLFRDVLLKLMPNMAQVSLLPRLLELLHAAAETSADTPFEIVIAPANREALESLLPDPAPFPIEIREEPTMAEGQAYFSQGSTTTQLDLGAAQAEMAQVITDFFQLQHQEAQNEQSTHG